MSPVQSGTQAWVHDEDGGDAEEFKRLSASEAEALRTRQPPLAPWVVVCLQNLVGLLLAALGGWWMNSASVAWSLGYGTLVVSGPAAVMAWGIRQRSDEKHASLGAVRFMSWEFVKMAGSLGMLILAPWVLQPIHWLALVLGLVVGTKVYWLALLVQRRGR